jgi:hypothetical protein
MKRIGLIALASLIIVFPACARKATITTSNGSATVSTSADNSTTTITTNQGSVTAGKDAVDLTKLPVPVYPGSQTTTGSLTVNGANGSGQMVSLKSADSFDTVYNWYKSQLPAGAGQMKSSSGGSDFAEFVVSGKNASIMLSSKGAGETDIVITVSTTPPPK